MFVDSEVAVDISQDSDTQQGEKNKLIIITFKQAILGVRRYKLCCGSLRYTTQRHYCAVVSLSQIQEKQLVFCQHELL